jgi:hypothetical protein
VVQSTEDCTDHLRVVVYAVAGQMLQPTMPNNLLDLVEAEEVQEVMVVVEA